MQGEKFVKLFEVEGANVLYYKHFESNTSDEDTYEIKCIISFDGVTAILTIGYEDDEILRNEAFDKLSQKNAETIYQDIKNQFE